MLNRLSQQDRDDLHAWLSVELKGKLLMGTQCSGTDSPLLSWQAFVLGVKDVMGLDFQIVHQYSCEKNETKRTFIKQVWHDALIFKDIADLPNPFAPTHGGTEVPVPPIEHLVAGFPCTSVSRQSTKAFTKEHLTCIASKPLATGSVFDSILGGLENILLGVRFVLFENVWA